MAVGMVLLFLGSAVAPSTAASASANPSPASVTQSAPGSTSSGAAITSDDSSGSHPVLVSVWPHFLAPWSSAPQYRTLVLNGSDLAQVSRVNIGATGVACPSAACVVGPDSISVEVPSSIPPGFENVTAITASGGVLPGRPCWPDSCASSTTIGILPTPGTYGSSDNPSYCAPISPGALGESSGLEDDINGDNYDGQLNFNGGVELTPTFTVCLVTTSDFAPLWLNFTESFQETASASISASGEFTYSNLDDPYDLLGPSFDGVLCASFVCFTVETSIALEIQASLTASASIGFSQGAEASISQNYSFASSQWYKGQLTTSCTTGTEASGCASFNGGASIMGSLLLRLGPEIDIDAYGVAGVTIYPYAELNVVGGYSTSGGPSDGDCGGQALGFSSAAPAAPWVAACVSVGLEVGANVFGTILADFDLTLYGTALGASVMICDESQSNSCISTIDIPAGTSNTLVAYSAYPAVTYTWTSPCWDTSQTGQTISVTAPSGAGESCVITLSTGLLLSIPQIDLTEEQATVVATTPTYYAVQFEETGLTSGTSWDMTLEGTTLSSQAGTLTFSEPTGTYSFTTGSVTGYSDSPSSGSVAVSSSNPTPIQITYTEIPSSVTVAFDESGLASGQTWTVSFAGQPAVDVTGTSTSFTVAPSNYAYSIGSPSGYTASPSSGTVDVSTAGTTVDVTFTEQQSDYTVAFNENGLTGGATWSVTLEGVSQSSTSTSIDFTETSGSYTYAIQAVDYRADPSEGAVTVSGTTPAPISVTFSTATVYSEWTELSSSGPPSRQYASMIWDARDSEMLLFGGCSNAGCSSYLGDTWVFANGAWTQLSFSSGNAPSARAGAMIAFDTRDNYVVLFGGYGSSGYLNDTWTFAGNQWTQLSFGGVKCGGPGQPGCPNELVPPARAFAQMTFDAQDNYVFLFSGEGTSGYADGGIPDTSPFADYWSFSGGQWNFLSFISAFNAEHHGVVPTYTGSATYDAADKAVLIYGGYQDGLGYVSTGFNGEVLEYAGGNWNLMQAGEPYGATDVAYDPVSAFTVSFGGCTSSGSPTAVTGIYVNDGWNYPSLSPVPGSRCAASAAWDPAIDRVVVFGGATESSTYQDTWAYLGGLGVASFTATPGTITVGQSVAFDVAALGGTPPYSYAYNGLPAGCSPSSSQYQFTCSFASPGSFNEVVNVTDSSNPQQFYSATTSVQVNPPPNYGVTFSESGLPSGTGWSASIDGGAPQSTTSSSVELSEPNGSYSFLVLGPANYSAQPGAGTFEISGGPTTINVAFSRINYTIALSEVGLPAGLTWSITVNGATESLLTNGTLDVLSFSDLTNATYAYSVQAIEGWFQQSIPYSGSVTIHGFNASLALDYEQTQYTVAFRETGLPANLLWTITFDGVALNLTTDGYNDTLAWFDLVGNGSYSYSIDAIPGWTESAVPLTGSLAVDGANLEVNLTYHSSGTTKVKFKETGLPKGTDWSVDLNGVTKASTGSTISFSVTSGTYGYTAYISDGGNTTGSVTASGTPLEVVLPFEKVTFKETGLPSGTAWQISVNGATFAGTTDEIVVYLVNGTYAYQIGKVSGYNSAGSGSFTVATKSLLVKVKFTKVKATALSFGEGSQEFARVAP